MRQRHASPHPGADHLRYTLSFTRDTTRFLNAWGLNGAPIDNALHPEFSNYPTVACDFAHDALIVLAGSEPAVRITQHDVAVSSLHCVISEAIHELCEHFWVHGRPWLNPHGAAEEHINTAVDAYVDALVEGRSHAIWHAPARQTDGSWQAVSIAADGTMVLCEHIHDFDDARRCVDRQRDALSLLPDPSFTTDGIDVESPDVWARIRYQLSWAKAPRTFEDQRLTGQDAPNSLYPEHTIHETTRAEWGYSPDILAGSDADIIEALFAEAVGDVTHEVLEFLQISDGTGRAWRPFLSPHGEDHEHVAAATRTFAAALIACRVDEPFVGVTGDQVAGWEAVRIDADGTTATCTHRHRRRYDAQWCATTSFDTPSAA